MKKKYILSVTAITEISGEGQKCTAVAIEYEKEIDENTLHIGDYSVEGRTITGIYTKDKPLKNSKTYECKETESKETVSKENGSKGNVNEGNDSIENTSRSGRYVILELESQGQQGSTREMLGHGPGGRSKFHPAVVRVSQKAAIMTSDGECYPAYDEAVTSVRTLDELADQFRELSFPIPGTDERLNYQLYIPEGYNPEEKYPLVLFIHDAGACSDETIAPLAQGNGAVIWATKEEQRKHPCFILAPCYPRICANDDFEVTPEAEYTVMLINDMIERYAIDRERIYGTGQSMGCMMLCEINIRYPDLFGGCLLVAGQWNPDTMAACKDKNFWIIVSQGDRKAFPIMGACMDGMEKAGAKLTRGTLDAKAYDDELGESIRQLEAEGNHIHFTWFQGESIIPEGVTQPHPGMHHVLTWARAYDVTALRDWLFKQRLSVTPNE